ncbi:MAG: hypothetical protein DRN17_07720 [Thermoplasmata archaeon]|nr:MAG: hypothetical protein DRN17_07720 [Thermoplasmata archaeon]
MSSVFIAYNHKDKVIARFVYHNLSREPWNIEAFMDEFAIQPGEDIKQKCLEKAKSADLEIVILTQLCQTKTESVCFETSTLI